MTMPKWSTPTRQDYLVKLWAKYGNQCLLGHTACPILEHYVHYDSKLVLVPEAKTVKCVDTHGNLLKDSNGNQLYVTVFPLHKEYLKTKRIDRLYELKSEAIIKDWIADDKAQRQADYKSEYELRHSIRQREKPLHGKFSGIAKDIYYESQPLFYLEQLGISGLTFKPFAQVRLASSNIKLYVDIADVLSLLSKNQKRKALRYGKTSRQLQDNLDLTCWKAVKHFQANS